MDVNQRLTVWRGIQTGQKRTAVAERHHGEGARPAAVNKMMTRNVDQDIYMLCCGQRVRGDTNKVGVALMHFEPHEGPEIIVGVSPPSPTLSHTTREFHQSHAHSDHPPYTDACNDHEHIITPDWYYSWSLSGGLFSAEA